MDRPKNHDALLEALFEGRATAEEAARLLGETSGEEIEELAELVETLGRIDPELALPSDAEFGAARRAVLARIEAKNLSGRGGLGRWLPVAAALAAGVAAFAVGLAVGRGEAAPTPPAPPLTLTELMDHEASQSIRGTGDTPFRYSNLRLRELDGDRLAVTVDVAAQLDLVRPKNDPLVSDILADAVVSEPSLGARLKAVRLAGSNPRLHRALASAALHDLDVSVRLRALTRLVEQSPADPETQETLLAVLASEESVAMRLLAIDSLADDYLSPDLLESLDETTGDDGEGPVLWRAQQRVNRRSL
jgi:hypothetical protein